MWDSQLPSGCGPCRGLHRSFCPHIPSHSVAANISPTAQSRTCHIPHLHAISRFPIQLFAFVDYFTMASLPTSESTTSFWHSEPSKFLLGHRTTLDLPRSADIVIVGSGITGTSAARFLAEDERAKGLNVVMLDAREACWGATGRVSSTKLSLWVVYYFGHRRLTSEFG